MLLREDPRHGFQHSPQHAVRSQEGTDDQRRLVSDMWATEYVPTAR